MPGPSPNTGYVGYDPSPSGIPETESPAGRGPRFNVQASPNDMGAQIGGALEKFGAEGQQVGNDASQLALKYQGMLNESYATNAETQFITKAGELDAKFKSRQGLDLVQAAPEHIAALTSMQQEIRKNLPGGAARAYDQLTERQLAYRVNEANLAVAQGIKAADLESAKGQIAVSVASAGDMSVATNDDRFNHVLQDIHFGQGRMMQNQGWGDSAGMQQNADGTHSFSNKDGQNAYDQMTNVNVSKAWEDRLKAISENGNVMQAYEKYKDNYDRIPPQGKVAMDQYFAPKIRDYQARGISENVLGQQTQQYNDHVYGNLPKVNDVADAIHGQESNGALNATTSVDNAHGGWQIKPETFNQYSKPGETIDNPKDNETVGRRIIDDYKTRYPDDPARVAVAYFSGPGNVSPPGSPTPWVNDAKDGNGKSVSSYVNDVTGRMNGGASNGKMVPSIADQYKTNYASILNQSREQAEQTHPGDVEFAEKAEAHTKQRMDAIIQQDKLATEAQQNTVLKALDGSLSNGQKPQTIDQLQGISPEVKTAWNNLLINNPKAAEVISNKMVGAKEDGKLGTGFSYLQQDALKGKLDQNDLLYHVGDDLTQQGFDKLKTMIKAAPSPDQKSESDQMATFLKYGHERILHSSLFHNTAEAEDAYQGWFSSVDKAIKDGQEKKIPMQSMLDPQSKDYVGGNVKQFTIPLQKQLEDRAARINERLGTSQPITEDRKRQPNETPEQYLARIK